MTITLDGTTGITTPSLSGPLNGTVGATTPAAGVFTSVNTPDTFGFKNRIINGAMVIDQRNVGASVTATTANEYSLDRWKTASSVSSKFTVQQSSVVPTGYINSLLVTSSSAYSVGAGDLFIITQRVEGLNSFDLGFGAAGASSVTLSFWVRSSLTGTFGGSLANSANDRSYPFTYTISTANTFEQKSVTIAGDTSGTWLTTSGIGIRVNFGLGVGSTYSGTAGAWAATEYDSATGAVSVVGTSGATWYVTGVQLEKGSTATSFDVRPYGTEFQLCQRYCYKISTSGGYSSFATTGQFVSTTRVDFPILFPTYMRASPTATYTAANTYLPSSAGTDFTPSAVASVGSSASPQAIAVNFTVSSGTAGRAATLTDLNTTSSSMIFSAEL